MIRRRGHDGGIRASGFTIVELLIVIGILASLMGLLLPALSGAQKRSFKSRELNALRQVGIAWNLYANSANDQVLPGYLDPLVQMRWKLTYEFQDRSAIQPEMTARLRW